MIGTIAIRSVFSSDQTYTPAHTIACPWRQSVGEGDGGHTRSLLPDENGASRTFPNHQNNSRFLAFSCECSFMGVSQEKRIFFEE